uniref:Uncharacterized protein n=1 Tax=Cuerna arida TaxID=1464854 RepID=A0A1B6G487_9HEMI
MSDGNRSYLERHSKRVEHYKSLVYGRKILFNKNYEVKLKRSQSSIDGYRKNKENKVDHISTQSEFELTSVMTRSAARKYKTVGAIHNKVNFEKELKVRKRWPPNISYSIPEPYDDHTILKDSVAKSFDEVMSFCKCALALKAENTVKRPEMPEDCWELGGQTASFIDLSPYLTQEPIIVNGNDETQITLHLNENLLPQHYIDIIPFSEEQNGALVIQEHEEDYKTISSTIHSRDGYVSENKKFSNSNSYFKANNTSTLNFLPYDPMISIYNDHTYAQKYFDPDSPQLSHSENVGFEDEFKLEDGLKDLLLNTAILKCVICGEPPQEMTSYLENAKNNIDVMPFV